MPIFEVQCFVFVLSLAGLSSNFMVDARLCVFDFVILSKLNL